MEKRRRKGIMEKTEEGGRKDEERRTRGKCRKRA